MNKLQVVNYPDPILQRPASPIEEVTRETEDLMVGMVETMYESNGVGLAAPQVGVPQRICVIETAKDLRNDEPKPQVFINPIIEERKGDVTEEEEGCLSLPGIFVQVPRHESVTVSYMLLDGKRESMEAHGLLARIFQHEVDHLDGKLIIDRIGFIKKLKLRRKLKSISNG